MFVAGTFVAEIAPLSGKFLTSYSCRTAVLFSFIRNYYIYQNLTEDD